MNPESFKRKFKGQTAPPVEKLPAVSAAEVRQAGQPSLESYYSRLVKKFDDFLKTQAPEDASEDSYARNVAEVNLQRLSLDNQPGIMRATIRKIHLVGNSSLNDPGDYFLISYNFVPDADPASHIFVDTEEFRPRYLMYDKERNSSQADSLALPLAVRAYQLQETLAMINKAAADAKLNPQLHPD